MEINIKSDKYFMEKALQEAHKALDADEVPVGAIITYENEIISRGYNYVEHLNDVTAHAEMQAFTSAADYIGGKYLNGCTLYVTLEPCLMCIGAINHARINRVIFGAPDSKNKVLGSSENLILKPFLNDSCSFDGGILEEECKEILQSFFKKK